MKEQLKKIKSDVKKWGPASLESEAISTFEEIMGHLSPFNPHHVGVEFTNEQTLFTIVVVEPYRIYMEVEFEPKFVTLTAFDGVELALNISGSTELCMERVKSHLSRHLPAILAR